MPKWQAHIGFSNYDSLNFGRANDLLSWYRRRPQLGPTLVPTREKTWGRVGANCATDTRRAPYPLPPSHGYPSILSRQDPDIRPYERYYRSTVLSGREVPCKWQWRRCTVGVLDIFLEACETIYRRFIYQRTCLASCYTKDPNMWIRKW
jgi:hypothetical protein